MATAAKSFLRNTFFLLLSLLVHLGCFMLFASQSSGSKKRKITPAESNPHQFKPVERKRALSSWFKKLFSSSNTNVIIINPNTHHHPESASQARTIPPSTSPTVVSSRSSALSDTILTTPSRKRRNLSISDISLDHPSFPLRNDIFPCPTCGEIFHKTHLLETHQYVKHAVSELHEGDSGKNIVKIIFATSWTNKEKTPTVHRILKIHNAPKILAKFEEYREFVKTRARTVGKKDERCIADGNELLRFHCTTFICNLGQNGNSSICCQNYCSVCGIIRVGFSGKMDGISTMSSSWKAHLAIGEDLEEEFGFMNVKRIMLICRVVAGRVGGEREKDESGFDSVVGRGDGIGGGTYLRSEEDELLVFNPRAVLPCFAIVYSV